jgi:alpha-mannosidase
MSSAKERAPISNAPSGVAVPVSTGESVPRPLASADRSVHLVGHAHLDPVWLWPWQEGYQEARATFRSALDRMIEYPDFVFTCDQIVLLSWVEESDPDLFAEICARVAEGRWVNVGGWWVEPDCNMPGAESFVRQGLYGQRYLQSRFSRMATVGMNTDPFGHNAMLPQILRGQGMDSYVFLRPGPHEGDLESSTFWWEAPDGSRVLAYRIPNAYHSGAGALDRQLDHSIAAARAAGKLIMVFYGIGNHGGGPTRANLDSIHRFDRMGSFGRLRLSSPREYLDAVLAQVEAGRELPVRRDDLQHHAPGCYSAHSGIKAWQQRAQAAVLAAERWAALLTVGAPRTSAEPDPYPRERLEAAWKQVLFNQFHDVLPGSAIESSYEDARDQLGEAVAIAKRITTRAHNVIARRIDIPYEVGSQPLVVFNPHPWPVQTDVVMHYIAQPAGVHVVDETGTTVLAQPARTVFAAWGQTCGAIAFRSELPGLGYRLYRLRPGAAPQPVGSGLEVDPLRLANEHLEVVIDATTGWLTTLRDRRSGVDVVAGATPHLHTQICQDPTDTWGHRVVSYAWPGVAMAVERILLTDSGPLRGRIRVERRWRSSTLIEEISLGPDDTAVRVDVTLDWREPQHLLKLRFPTSLADPRATYEIPFGHLARPVDGAEEPAQSWVDLSGVVENAAAGLTVIITGKHGFDTSPGDRPSIGVTAVRSPVYSWHDPLLLDPDGIYSHQDLGRQRFSYELVPHRGDWREADPIRRARLLVAPVRAMQESSHPGPLPRLASFVDDGGGAVMITAVKGGEDAPEDDLTGADLIIRAVETRGEQGRVRIDLPVIDRVLEDDFGPYQIRTFRVPMDPALPVVPLDLLERELA